MDLIEFNGFELSGLDLYTTYRLGTFVVGDEVNIHNYFLQQLNLQPRLEEAIDVPIDVNLILTDMSEKILNTLVEKKIKDKTLQQTISRLAEQLDEGREINMGILKQARKTKVFVQFVNGDEKWEVLIIINHMDEKYYIHSLDMSQDWNNANEETKLALDNWKNFLKSYPLQTPRRNDLLIADDNHDGVKPVPTDNGGVVGAVPGNGGDGVGAVLGDGGDGATGQRAPPRPRLGPHRRPHPEPAHRVRQVDDFPVMHTEQAYLSEIYKDTYKYHFFQSWAQWVFMFQDHHMSNMVLQQEFMNIFMQMIARELFGISGKVINVKRHKTVDGIQHMHSSKIFSHDGRMEAQHGNGRIVILYKNLLHGESFENYNKLIKETGDHYDTMFIYIGDHVDENYEVQKIDLHDYLKIFYGKPEPKPSSSLRGKASARKGDPGTNDLMLFSSDDELETEKNSARRIAAYLKIGSAKRELERLRNEQAREKVEDDTFWKLLEMDYKNDTERKKMEDKRKALKKIWKDFKNNDIKKKYEHRKWHAEPDSQD